MRNITTTKLLYTNDIVIAKYYLITLVVVNGTSRTIISSTPPTSGESASSCTGHCASGFVTYTSSCLPESPHPTCTCMTPTSKKISLLSKIVIVSVCI